ncbi:hypothetical protein TRIUR3_24681 [Triticum urartu]|uniref:Uncharacterized protein n=1 Tax=Triticum urartu TaxID=4572 RepID=M7Z0P9_TRIUA|nr:hypothetical protein TRIUR3_24681 [Triticum urartu]
MEAEPARQNSPTEITIDCPEPDHPAPPPAPNPTNENSQPQYHQPPANGSSQPKEVIESYKLMLELSKYILLLATLVATMVLASFSHDHEYNDPVQEKRLRKVLMLLATFAVSVTYVAGMSTPGGFWDNTENGHRPGDAILKDRHGARLRVFLYFNTTAFVASLLVIVVLLDRKPRVTGAYWCIAVALISLIVSYTAGSCRETDTNFYVGSLVIAVLAFMALLQVAFV